MVRATQAFPGLACLQISTDTANELQEDESFSNISVFKEIGQYVFSLICDFHGLTGQDSHA